MRKASKLLLPVLLLAALGLMLVRCTNPTAGTATETENVVGKLYLADGTTPAAGAKVLLVPVDHNPRSGLAKTAAAAPRSTSTDANGVYKLDSVPEGTYNVLAGGSGSLAFQDSITVDPTDTLTEVPPDTLKAPGSLVGRVEMQGSDDPRTVFMLVMGTNTWTAPDAAGAFSLAEMAEGSYHVRILSTLDDYEPLDTTLSVTAGKADTLTSPIKLRYTGIPIPTGLKISYDPLKQVVTLTWSKPTAGRAVQSYTVYRKRSDSTEFKVLKGGVTDTTYRDSTGVQDQTYEYRVAAMDTNKTVGVMCSGVSMKIASVFTYVKKLGETGSQQGQYSNSISISIYDGMVYVLDVMSTTSRKVIVYDTAGVFVDEVELNNSYNPYDIVIKNKESFYLCSDKQNVFWVDMAGNQIVQFSGGGTNAGNYVYRWYMAIANNGNLFITDAGNNRIQVFTDSGNYIRQLSIPGHPTNMAFLDSNRLYVTYDNPGATAGSALLDTTGTMLSELHFYVDLPIVTSAGNIIGRGGFDDHILIYSQTGSLLAEFGQRGDGDNEFRRIVDIAISPSNKLYVIDNDANKKIKIFSLPADI